MKTRAAGILAIVVGRVVAIVLACGDASAEEAEPLALAYDAPSGCPDANAFFRLLAARTKRARKAAAGEVARVLHVNVDGAQENFSARLRIEEGGIVGSPREVRGTTCVEVVDALGLIAALAVDPEASTAAAASEPASPTRSAEAPSSDVVLPATPPNTSDGKSSTRVAIGAQIEAATLADVVFAGRLFGELAFGEGTNDVLAPAFRLAFARSLDVDRTPSLGAARLRWTQASLEGCPIKIRFASTIHGRPCAGVSGGVLQAEGSGVGVTQSRNRPWVSGAAYARLSWELAPWLVAELDAGAVVPFFRETFFFEPNVSIYEAPIAAFSGHFGAAVRFP